jgi:propionyl-CoA carboxylase alpha chain
MFSKILIANRGEIACRIMRTAKKMGIKTVAVYSDADKMSQHVYEADESYHIGAAPAIESYLNVHKIIAAVNHTGAQAVHPGYGFLSEQAHFVEALTQNGTTFIGPPASAINAMGDKITSKKIAHDAGVRIVPGHMGIIPTTQEAISIARKIGYPVMIKASAGGGGKGMRIAWSDQDIVDNFQATQRESASSFGDDRIFIEKFIQSPRHIEIQILADNFGNIVHLGERECSLQRRNQKVREEAPSPFLQHSTRQEMCNQAIALAKAVGYTSAGTVEFIADAEQNFYFLEMNTRLQVEHPVTELTTGLDLVEQMISVAANQPLSFTQDMIQTNGHAIEARVYAENPQKNFMPSIGRLKTYRSPEESRNIRIDSGVTEGSNISIYYDPMIAKVCSWEASRTRAISTLNQTLHAFELDGIQSNLGFLSALLEHENFINGQFDTQFIEKNLTDLLLTRTDNAIPFVCLSAILSYMAIHTNQEEQIQSIIHIEGTCYRVTLEKASHIRDEFIVFFEDGKNLRVELDGFNTSKTLCKININDTRYIFQISKTKMGWFLQKGRAQCEAIVLSQTQSALLAKLPKKQKTETQQHLLSPMPGIVTNIFVKEGQIVQSGDPLCTVEAMKMENVLRSEKEGEIKKINYQCHDNVNVNDVLIEFAV